MFFKIRIFAFLIFLTALFLNSCNEYQKVLKNEDIKAKYDLGERFYKAGDYKRANRLFEQIAPRYVGKPQGERVMFFFADSYFKTAQYYLAGYQYERFIKSYPNSDKIQEAIFREAQSYYKLSPRYSLDQTDTDKALNKLQNFINTYPESKFFSQANEMAQELTTKKQKKEIEIAKQFDKLGEFNYPILVSSIKAFNNFISDNPGSIYREDAFFYRLKSEMTLAKNSTIQKQEKRYIEAQKYYQALMKSYPDTKYKKEVADIYKKIKKGLELPEEKTSK